MVFSTVVEQLEDELVHDDVEELIEDDEDWKVWQSADEI